MPDKSGVLIEDYRNFCPGVICKLYPAMYLLGEPLHQFETQRTGFRTGRLVSHTDAIISQQQGNLFAVLMHADGDSARAFIRECIFHRIGYGLIDDEGQRDGLGYSQPDGFDVQDKMNFTPSLETIPKIIYKLGDIFIN